MKYNLLVTKIKSWLGTIEEVGPKKTVDILNEWFHDLFAYKVDEINNKNLTKLEKQIGNTYDLPRMIFDGEGVTIADGNSGAFQLNPACTFKQEYAKAKQVILRIAFSYETAVRMTNSQEAFYKTVGPVVDYGIKKMTEIVGPGPQYGCTYITCKTPGRKAVEYFLEMNNTAGFELRFYSDLANLKEEKSNEPQPTKSPILSKTNRR